MTTSRNPGAPPPGPPEAQEDRQRLFEDWVTTLRRNGKSGVKAPVPLAVQEAIRSSSPPPADPDEGKTQVYRGHESSPPKAEANEAAPAPSLDVAQTQVYRIPEKVVARARERLQAQQASAPPKQPAQAAVQAESEGPNPDAIPTDRPPNMPTDDHTAVFVPPPDLLARAQRHLEALAAEEAARAAAAGEATGTNEPADLSLVEALAAVEAREGAQLLAAEETEAQVAPSEPPRREAEPAPTAPVVGHDSMSTELASLRPRYVGYIGWTSVVLLLAGVAYAVLSTIK